MLQCNMGATFFFNSIKAHINSGGPGALGTRL